MTKPLSLAVALLATALATACSDATTATRQPAAHAARETSTSLRPLQQALAPQQIVRSTDAPAVTTFTIAGFGPRAVLHVVDHGAASGEITVDGARVVDPSQFSHAAASFDVSFTLGNPSVIGVRLTSKPGSSITISVDAEGATAATLNPAGGTASLLGGQVTLAVPANAVTSPVSVTVSPPDLNGTDPANAYAVGGSVVEFGPEGTTFATPVTMTLHYDPAKLPRGFTEAALGLGTFVDGAWKKVDHSAVDPVTHTVSGQTSHFSVYGVVAFPTFTQLAIGDAQTIGGAFVCGVTPASSIYCWGANRLNELGAPSTNTCGAGSIPCSLTPTLVSGGASFKFVAAGGQHACGITLAGDAYCWGGANAANGAIGTGQLGDGSNTNQPVPALVAGGHKWKTLAAGENETCGITTDGDTYCWGLASFGMLGTTATLSSCGTASCALTPVQVATPTPLTEISVGLNDACGVGIDASAWCWGTPLLNPFPALGDGVTASSSTPIQVAKSLSVRHIAAGTLTICAVTTTNEGYCWGRNDGVRLLGIGTGPNASSPVAISGGLALDSISTANANNVFPHACALAVDGNAWCWGNNSAQQLGSTATNETCSVVNFRGTTFTSPCNNVPVEVGGGHTFRSVVTGIELSCGLGGDGQAYCWGNDGFGQIGDGTTSSNRSPTVVITPGP